MADIVVDGALNPSLLKSTPETDKAKFNIRVFSSGEYTYVGKTVVSLADRIELPIWQIMRVYAPIGSDLIVSYADGNTNFDNIWNDKISKSYV